MTTTAEPRLTGPEQKNADLLEEVLFLLSCDLGEAGILHALGYTGKAPALKRRLARLHRHDLIPRIFEADALYHHRHADMGIPKATARKARA
ncbi:hypothetical protein SEA_VIBAKI_45 [Arthrobacter phage Vibaki]|uniref:Uncharacterized protein n=1 Tax=Arthrobacter phage Vibaki TaxID=2593333 RepID=A0A514TZ39_9CAUD|nr:hypothetical protein HYP95_gp45 [Arthrobacter phage Vibaki]QDK01925.1 hypothetical protein SEA_VIBAKI_45 [Arthrobacter phage Vibaki]